MSKLSFSDFTSSSMTTTSTNQFDTMILSNGRNTAVNKNKFYPLTKLKDNSFVEGYWFSNDSNESKHYPFPKATSEPVDPNFIDKLETIMSFGLTGSSKQTDNRVTIESYFGSSECRLCGCSNGSQEFTLVNNGTTFRVPNGILHYYKDHNVQPSYEFYQFVLSF